MSHSRMHNFSAGQPDPVYPKPKGMVVLSSSKCDALDKAIYLVWSYVGDDADSIDGYTVRVALDSDKTTILREVYVGEPDTDVIIDNLVNLTVYYVTVTPVNRGGEGQPSFIGLMPVEPLIEAPVLKTLTGGDGQASATWTLTEPCQQNHSYAWVSYEAVNELGTTITEHVVGGDYPSLKGTLPLTNDHTWTVSLVAVAKNDKTGVYYPSSLSNKMEVKTEQPLPPYKPRLTGAQIDPQNAGFVNVSFAPGIQNVTATKRKWWHKVLRNESGRIDITSWQLRLIAAKDGTVTTFDIPKGTDRTYTTEKVGLGTYDVDVRANNEAGWSEWSNSLKVTYTPTDKRPFTADKSFGTYESDTYYYAIFDCGNDVKDGWDRTWKCTLTEAGKALNYDVLLIGAGGGGKGTTATLGKGGNGGGGQMNGANGVNPKQDTFTVFASIGGRNGIDPKNTSITFDGVETVAFAGKTATGAADATGYPRTYITEWADCKSAFGWLEPDSQFVGGVAIEGRQGYPNGLGWGCAGAGTKNAPAGISVEGLVVIRWAK
jgi:hypothetical protein